MIINWYGNGCYKVQASGFDIVIDPESSQSGSRLKGNLTLHTVSSFPAVAEETEIIGPGEYEVSGIVIRGASAAETTPSELHTIYRVVVDDLQLGFLGNTGVEMGEKELDMLGEIDILFVPSNDIGAKLIKSVGPKMVVPGWGDPMSIAKDMGVKPEPQEKLVIKKKDLEEVEGLKVVILES